MKKYIADSYVKKNNNNNVIIILSLVIFVAVAGVLLLKKGNDYKYESIVEVKTASTIIPQILEEIPKVLNYHQNEFEEKLKNKPTKKNKTKNKKQVITMRTDSMETADNIKKNLQRTYIPIISKPDSGSLSASTNIQINDTSKFVSKRYVSTFQKAPQAQIQKNYRDSLEQITKEQNSILAIGKKNIEVSDIKNGTADTTINNEETVKIEDEFEDFVFPEIENDIWETQEKMHGNNVAEIDMNDNPEKYHFSVISKIQEGYMDKIGNSIERGDKIKIILPEKCGQYMIVKIWAEDILSFSFLDKNGAQIEKGDFETKKTRLFLKHNGSAIIIHIKQNDSNKLDTIKYKIEIAFMESKDSSGGNSPPHIKTVI